MLFENEKMLIDTLPNDKTFDLSKLKAFADDKTNLTQKLKFEVRKGRKHCGKKDKMLVTSIFSLTYNVFNRSLIKCH